MHIDHLFLEDRILLLVIDSLSKYIEVEIDNNVSAGETVTALRLIFSRHGLPDIIVSDNATSFTASEFQEFLTQNAISHITSPPYMSSSNGQAERGVRVIKDLMKKNKVGSFKQRLCNILLYYRSTPHSVTNVAPSVALNGRKYVTIKDRVNPLYSHCSSSKLKTQIPFYEVGDSVQVLNLSGGSKWLQGTVVSRLGDNVYAIYIPSLDLVWKRHVHQMLHHSTSTHVFPEFSSSNEHPGSQLTSGSNRQNNLPRRSTRIRKPVDRYC